MSPSEGYLEARVFDEERMDAWYSAEGSPSPLGVTWIENEKAFNFALYSKNAAKLRSFCIRPTSISGRSRNTA